MISIAKNSKDTGSLSIIQLSFLINASRILLCTIPMKDPIVADSEEGAFLEVYTGAVLRLSLVYVFGGSTGFGGYHPRTKPRRPL